MTPRRALLAALLAATAFVAGCSTTADESMFAPATTQAPPDTTTTAAPATQPCEGNTDASGQPITEESYPALAPLPAPGNMPPGSYMAEIQQRGRLVVGVSADTLLFGARNPLTNRIEGFDIDILKEVAKAIFSDARDDNVDDFIEYRVITYADRLPSLESGAVDIVAHTMTINCTRWQRIAFSTEYFAAGQKVLVRTNIDADGVEELGGQRICVADGSTNLENIKKPPASPDIQVVVVPDLTDCLVLFQQGDVDGITGDDTVLAGFVAQDPYAKVIGEKFSEEPYGLGISHEHVEFVQFVNAVLERVRTGPRWAEIYDKWVGDRLGPRPEPPTPVYGRPLS